MDGGLRRAENFFKEVWRPFWRPVLCSTSDDRYAGSMLKIGYVIFFDFFSLDRVFQSLKVPSNSVEIAAANNLAVDASRPVNFGRLKFSRSWNVCESAVRCANVIQFLQICETTFSRASTDSRASAVATQLYFALPSRARVPGIEIN